MFATSEPAPASLMAMDFSVSPRAISERYSSFCSGVAPARLWPRAMMLPTLSQPRESSSAMIA
jgi:hypothetical protein